MIDILQKIVVTTVADKAPIVKDQDTVSITRGSKMVRHEDQETLASPYR